MTYDLANAALPAAPMRSRLRHDQLLGQMSDHLRVDIGLPPLHQRDAWALLRGR